MRRHAGLVYFPSRILRGVARYLDGSRSIENLGLLVGQLAYGSGFGDHGSVRAYVAS